MYDYFDAPLRCPRCSHLSTPDELTNMQTKIREDADGTELRVGFRFDKADLQTRRILESSYALVKDPDPATVVQLLNVWSCPSCETEQWARIEIVDGLLAKIEAVVMSKEILNEANFISEVDGELLAATLLDIPVWEVNERKLDPVEVLRQRLI